MTGAFRAIVWLRWRLLVNSIRSGGRRDALEQASRALAMVIPLALVALSLGSVVAVGALGFMGGRAIATHQVEPNIIVFLVRITLIVMTALVIIVTLASPVQTVLTRYSRLLLLPIPRHTLHAIEVAANVADPWLGFMVPGMVLFGIGLAFHGSAFAGLVTLGASLAMVALLASLGSLIGFMVAWLFRSRRRGEVFTLVLVMGMSLLAFIPAAISKDFETRKRDRQRREEMTLEKFDESLPAWSVAVPSEIYGRVVLAAVEGHRGASLLGVVAIAGEAMVLFILSSAAHRRLLDTIEGDHRRRRRAEAHSVSRRLPFLTPQASAVAIAQFRTAIRTVRGRLALLLPGPLIAILTVVFRGMPDDSPWFSAFASDGHFVLAAGIVFSIYAQQAFTMNLFGSDRQGLAMQFLAPIDEGEIALGKIIGCAMLLAVAVLLCVGASIAVAPFGSPFYWIATIVGGWATYMLLSPAFIWCSALFPIAADLTKTGSGGNPHPLPMLVGTLLTLGLAVPAGLILAADQLWIHRPPVALVLMIAWALMAMAVAIPLVGVASRTIRIRRENLMLVAAGR